MPNNAIYKFEGNIELEGLSEKVSLGAENMVLRGSSLKNTEYIYGVVCYAGHDTKIMLNSVKAQPKYSKLQIFMN